MTGATTGAAGVCERVCVCESLACEAQDPISSTSSISEKIIFI